MSRNILVQSDLCGVGGVWGRMTLLRVSPRDSVLEGTPITAGVVPVAEVVTL